MRITRTTNSRYRVQGPLIDAQIAVLLGVSKQCVNKSKLSALAKMRKQFTEAEMRALGIEDWATTPSRRAVA